MQASRPEPASDSEEVEAMQAVLEAKRRTLPPRPDPTKVKASKPPPVIRRETVPGPSPEQTELQKRYGNIVRLVSEAGGKRYEGYTFEAYQATSDYQRSVKRAAHDWAENFPEMQAKRSGLVLYGPVGTGKDHLLFAAVRLAIFRHGATAKWQNGRDLFGEIRDRIGDERPERELISKLEHADILVLSDPVPVVGSLSAHQADMFYRIIENRYAAGKITCATLNIANDDEADQRLGAPTWDRIIDQAVVAACSWASRRRPLQRLLPAEKQ